MSDSQRATERSVNLIAGVFLVLGLIGSADLVQYSTGMADIGQPPGLLGPVIAVAAFFTLLRQNWARWTLILVLGVLGAVFLIVGITVFVTEDWSNGVVGILVAAILYLPVRFLGGFRVTRFFAARAESATPS